jgi:hypothetical protein
VAAKRNVLPGYLSRVGSVPVAGYRSMLAFWLGGACSYPYVEPPIPPQPKPPGGGAGGGPGYWPHGKKKPAKRPLRNDDDEVAMLVATAWVTVWDH